MKFEDKNILVISPEPWDHIFVSKHHYAIHLARKGNRVFFLNPPRGNYAVVPTEFENVWSVHYRGFVQGLRFFPVAVQHFLMKAVFKKISSLCGRDFDVIWSFDNSVFYDFRIFPKHTLTISHIVDLNQDFQTDRAASSAACCLCTTDQILTRLTKYNSRVFKIPHGFNKVERGTTVTLPGDSHIKAVYSGNLSMPFIDWFVLHTIVKANPDVDFCFIGPNSLHCDLKANGTASYKQELFTLTNVYAVGRVPSHTIPAYLDQADILIVCYQEAFFDDQANPHKIMEYLGSGKVIVSTYTGEFARCNSLIEMARKNSEFPEIFRRVVREITFYNREEICKKRKDMAAENTYEKQIERIEKYLNQ